MKLLEQKHTPALHLRGLRSKGRHQIRLPQQPLKSAVVSFLIRACGGASPMQLQVKLIPPDRQRGPERLQPIEIFTNCP